MTIKVTEVNAETGETILRDATEAEIAQIEKDAIEQEKINAAKAQAAAKKAAAQAKLEALGLTTEDLKALGL
jgi:antitoxin component HigA of HigAB toxin-antitoxin module